MCASPSPAAITATPLKAAAASTDGPLPGQVRLRRPAWALGRGRGGRPRSAAGGCTGPTSVPTGWTRPSAAKPQLSSFSAESISVSAGQCSNVTISVTPLRLAIPT